MEKRMLELENKSDKFNEQMNKIGNGIDELLDFKNKYKDNNNV